MKKFLQSQIRVMPAILLAATCSFSNLANAAPTSSEPRNPEWATPVASQQNLFRVTPSFFRSARLKSGDVSLVQSLGVKTVISLRSFHSDDKVLKNSGIKIQRVPINTWAIGDEHVVKALRAIKTAEKDGPVLLHCQHGADRTGMIAAMYRLVYMGWSREQALDEMQNGGYGYHSMWKNIVKYMQTVDVAKIKQAVEASAIQ